MMKIKLEILMMVLLMASNFPMVSLQRSKANLSEDATPDFLQLAQKYGYSAQEYNIITEDGYRLKMFRIPGNKEKPVLLIHGILDSADTFILRGKDSLAAVLADKGYDVWLGNTRGNRYNHRHELLDSNNKQFWDFSFHEMGVIDLKAFIDFILSESSIKKVNLIGHSLGNTLFYVLGSEKPEYNDKVNIGIALAPVCNLNLNNLRAPVSTLAKAGPMLNYWLLQMNEEQVFGDKSFTKQMVNNICIKKPMGYSMCAKGIFSALTGEDMDELEPEFYYSLIKHFPTSTSRKNLQHLLQVAKQNRFAQFDYGREDNMKFYNSTRSPQYKLDKVTMKIALLVGKNDKITPLKNIVVLKNALPNVVSYRVMEHKKFNHMDHIWGKHMNEYLFPHIFEVLDKYS